jgi:hypothetical protein
MSSPTAGFVVRHWTSDDGAGCRCLKESLDELRIESVRYGRVTGKPESDSGPEIGIWEGGGSILVLRSASVKAGVEKLSIIGDLRPKVCYLSVAL